MFKTSLIILLLPLALNSATGTTDCTKLLVGQFLCPDPDSSYKYIDEKTQSIIGCTEKGIATVRCLASEGIVCQGTGNNTFYGEVPCDWTNGKHFDVALILSIFLGVFGADRFYLGYYGMGCLKAFTLGFFFIWHLIDIILIASQIVTPADGSKYIIPFYGPKLAILTRSDNFTYRVPQFYEED